MLDILPTAKAGGFLHQPPLHSNRGCCVLHDVRQALLPVCPTVRYGFVLYFIAVLYYGSPFNTCTNCKHYRLSFTAPYIPITKTRGFTAQSDKLYSVPVLFKQPVPSTSPISGSKMALLFAL